MECADVCGAYCGLAHHCGLSAVGQIEVMKAMHPNMSEAEIQGIHECVYKKYGSEYEGYPSIVGGGNNGCILHYVENNKTIVAVDPSYFRPTEVDNLLGDATKAREKLGWKPRISFEQLISEMVAEDMKEAQKDHLCRQEGYKTYDHFE